MPIHFINSDRLCIPTNCDRPSKKLTNQRSPITSKQLNSNRDIKFLNYFGNGMLKSLQIFFAKFSSI
ncbi:MAG: hypothetical protein ACK451_18185 [Pseudanabaena sp.]